jgi:hypothetical protein
MTYRRFIPDKPYRLHVKGVRFAFARMTGAQLADLLDLLVKERDSDRDYFINAATLRYLDEQGADEELLGLLAQQVGTSDGVEIEWTEDAAEE